MKRKEMVTVFVSGKFKVIHTGHLRFFKQARLLGKRLVVGIDIENLSEEEISWRFQALSNLALVDEVHTFNGDLIPLLEKIRPDVILKGKEFELLENKETLYTRSTNTKLLFSSGESFFSEYDLMGQSDTKEPSSDFEFPIDVIRRHKTDFNFMENCLDEIVRLNVLVIGDLIIDEIIRCHPLGMSAEEPSVVVTPIDSRRFVGGAGIVAAHCKSLGANVKFMTCLGDDELANWSLQSLSKLGVDTIYVKDNMRPTTLKQRFRSGNQTLLKLSHLREEDIGEKTETLLLKKLTNSKFIPDIIIFSDFSYGVCKQELVQKMCEFGQESGSLISADSQSSSQIGSLAKYSHVDLLTPTERELRNELRDSSNGIIFLASKLQKQLSCDTLIVKMGHDGCIVNSLKEDISDELKLSTESIPSLNKRPVDASGAGDSLLAMTSMALRLGLSKVDAALLGSIAAAIQISFPGNNPLEQNQIKRTISRMSKYLHHE